METILILGGYGFLGSNIIDYASRFLSNKYKIIVFDFYATHPSGHKFENVIKCYKGDFTNIEDVKCIFDENKIDYIFHFISTTVPSTSNQNIVYDIESNLVPTISILDMAKTYNVKKVVFTSSGGAIYGASSQYLHKEEDPLFPISSYGVVKMAIEKYLKLYEHLYGLNFIALRLSNPYGAFHTSQKQGMINVALRKAINNEPFEVWGDGSNIKDYIYAEDVARIIFTLLEISSPSEIINVGSNKGHSINEILGIIRNIIPSFKISYQEKKSFDVPKVILDTQRMSDLGSFELIDIESGINKTYKWIMKQHTNRHFQ
jgi:UDP-glucose 4-epimerase